MGEITLPNYHPNQKLHHRSNRYNYTKCKKMVLPNQGVVGEPGRGHTGISQHKGEEIQMMQMSLISRITIATEIVQHTWEDHGDLMLEFYSIILGLMGAIAVILFSNQHSASQNEAYSNIHRVNGSSRIDPRTGKEGSAKDQALILRHR
ncbi:hypothetical protein VNO77_23059 [Canavalia gladiata]|uniref:Uncharacterized protein n=1 Tax=Canavalia gladiata TaxID=3824 RepID=A0AAN9QBE0_CANGL